MLSKIMSKETIVAALLALSLSGAYRWVTGKNTGI